MRSKRPKYVTLTTKSLTSPTPPSNIIRTYIAYASVSGTAEKLANQLNGILMEKFNKTRPGSKPFTSKVITCSDLLEVEAAELVLFVASTTGDGVGPKNGMRLYDNCFLYKYFDYRPFANINYAMFALGSKAYGDKFCAFGQDLNNLLEDIGGNRILPVEKCDIFEVQQKFDEWVEKVVPCVDQICRGEQMYHWYRNSTRPGYTEKDIMRQMREMAGEGVSVVGKTVNDDAVAITGFYA